MNISCTIGWRQDKGVEISVEWENNIFRSHHCSKGYKKLQPVRDAFLVEVSLTMWEEAMVQYASFATDACLKQFVDKQKRWKVLETGGRGEGEHRWWYVRKHAHAREVWGHAPRKKNLSRDSEIASDAIFATRTQGPCVLEHCSLYVTQQLVTGSHISRVSMSDVGIAVDWSQASKV